jgi:hypothetical protein
LNDVETFSLECPLGGNSCVIICRELRLRHEDRSGARRMTTSAVGSRYQRSGADIYELEDLSMCSRVRHVDP